MNKINLNTPLNIYFYFIFLGLAGLLIYAHYAAYYPVFWEAQFISGAYINDLISGWLFTDNFFVRFGEHLYPGYHILLAINYYLFDISLAYDPILSTLSILICAIIILRKLGSAINELGLWGQFAIVLSLLSPLQTPSMSMALASSISVILLVLIYSWILEVNRFIQLLLITAIYSIFFSGAYFIGLLATAIPILLSPLISRAQKSSFILILSICLALYLFLLGDFRKPSAEKLLDVDNIIKIGRFFLTNLSAAFLGKAFLESTGLIQVYYLVGIYTTIILTHIFYKNFGTNDKLRLIVLLLLFYGVSISVFVSFTRFGNGTDLAVGGWYQSHLKWIPFAIAYFIFSEKGSYWPKLVALPLLISMIIGGYFEIKKAPYVSDWLGEIAGNAVKVGPLVNELQMEIKDQDFKWNSSVVSETLNVLYKSQLGYYKKPIVEGLTHDNWILSNSTFVVLCPSQSKKVAIHFDVYAQDFVEKTGAIYHPASGALLEKELAYEDETLYIYIRGDEYSPFLVTNGDTRSLLAHVSQIDCVY